MYFVIYKEHKYLIYEIIKYFINIINIL